MRLGCVVDSREYNSALAMKRMKKRLLAITAALFFFTIGWAQDVAVKTNVIYDATATVNLGVEVGLAARWSLDISGNFNAWDMSGGSRWKHWLAQPEARYWFCNSFSKHFLGFHLLGGQYNIGGLKNDVRFLGTDYSGMTDHRYQGWGVGAGVAYGYAWILGKHWNLEAELGLGYIYNKYDVYQCAGCGKMSESGRSHHYVGATKAAISLVYVF